MNNNISGDLLELVGMDELPPEANLQLPDSRLVQYYKDYKDRIIHLDKDIDDTLFDEIWAILRWNKEDEDKRIDVKDRIPIRLLIHSYGGAVDSCFALTDVMKLSKTPVYTYNMNACMSAGAIIYINGHRRFAMPKSIVLFHQGEGGAGGTFSQITAQTENYKKLIGMLKDNIIEHTEIPKTVLAKKFKTEWYLYLEDQIKYGVTDYEIKDISQILNPKYEDLFK